MKPVILKLIFLLLLSISSKTYGQYDDQKGAGVASGFTIGYSSKGYMVGELYGGAQLNKVLVSLSLKYPFINDINVPVIVENRYSYAFFNTEVYAGIGYHLAGSDGKAKNPNSGLRPAYGVIQHFNNSPVILSAAMNGTNFTLQVGIFGIR